MHGRDDVPATEEAEPVVARLDGIDGTRADVPVARLGAELPERPAPAPADLTSLAGAEASDQGAARVAALGGGRRGGRGASGGTAAQQAEEMPDGPAPAKVIALFDTDGLTAPRGDARVARLTGAAAGRRRAGAADGGERADPDGRGARRRGGPRSRRRAADLAGGDTDVPQVEAGHAARSATAGTDTPGAGTPGADTAGADPAGAAAPSRRERGSVRSGRQGQRELDPDADPVAVAREICLRLLTDRARTRQELAQALSRRGVPAEAADSVLERFDEVGLIDDAAFAGQWVRSRHTHRGLARRAIAVELRRKGVSDEDAGEALAGLDAESEERRARELVDRKLRSLTVATPEQRASAARRLVGMLARKGYGAGIAYRVVKEALAEHGAESDELGDAEPPPED